MSHAAVYRVRPDVGAVIHFHSEKLWQECRYTLPTTDPSLEYGTPELALGLQQLVRGLDREVVQSVVMGGHKDGLLTFGPDLDGAGGAALELAGRIRG
jgi:ribulose-5-phosphate 4-epimerase/fuculose-1-phosphate aldolase